MSCQICSSNDLVKILDLGMHPPPLKFLNNNEPEQLFPLQLFFCNSCNLWQLGNAVDPSVLFKTYTYESGVSNSFKNHLYNFAKLLVDRFHLTSNDLVIDIASNDGTLLEGFSSFNIRILGVEPSNVADIAKNKGIPTVKNFFDEDVAKEILKKYGKAKVITAANIFAHVKSLDSFMKGVQLLLKEDGVFVTESQYLMDIVQKLEYDTIYHEHLRYYGIKQLEKLFDIYDMEIFDAERISAQGGSIRVFTSFKEKISKNNSVKELIHKEEEFGLNKLDTAKEFATRVENNKKDLRELLLKIKSEGKSIAGIGAPARSSTVLNFCKIDSKILDFIAEKGILKIGKVTPGTHIEVVDDKTLIEKQPDYALLLSWHLKDNLIPKIRNDGYKGKIIVPLPKIEIL